MKIYGGLACNLTLTKLCNYFTNILCRERHIGYGAGLKLVLGGLISSFLSVFLHMWVLQTCGMVGDIRGVTLGLLL
jgi:hypothetical protein